MIKELMYELVGEQQIAAINSQLTKGNKVIGFMWNLTYNSQISNSHSAPRGKVTNWGGYKTDLPRSYPGFHGRVWLRLDKDMSTYTSEVFSDAILHPGTGGGGSYDGPWAGISSFIFKHKPGREWQQYLHIFSWDCRVFLDDIPAVRDEVEKYMMWEVLSGRQESWRHHSFEWQHPETVAMDEKIRELVTA